ncbi:MAG: hypothetical protein J5497_06715, partial [Selenomonadaceae bacterium]|nr:hypothetical protein [Selenomonadaceae bacterium]
VRNKNYIDAGDGNNYINNSNVEKSTISAGSGNDTIITGGGQSDYYSSSSRTSIVAGAGDNRITVNSGITYGKVYAEGGNDLVSISGDGSDNIISVGDGRNTIITDNYYEANYNEENTIEAGSGSDLIRTSGNKNYINAGSGRNSITLKAGSDNTIITGKGNDTIELSANTNNNMIIFGGGNDIVYNYNSGDSIAAVGSLTKQNVGSDVVLTDGTSRMTLKGAIGKTTNIRVLSSSDNVYKILVADKTAGDTLMPNGLTDTTPPEPVVSVILKVNNTVGAVSLTGTNYDDTITNSGTTVTINGGKGDDEITNTGATVSIFGGKGDDSIDNSGLKVTIDGGAGDDEISNTGATVSIFGGKGDDSIINGGSNVTITCGKGDDTINNSGDNVLFQYNPKDGDDVITGFKANSTLRIADGQGTFTSAKSGNDLIVTVGKNEITLKGAANLSTVNIAGTEIFEPKWTLSGTTATYGTPKETSITVNGVKSLDGISLYKKVVTLYKSSLGTDNVTVSNGYTLALGNDVAQSTTTSAAWSLSNSTATYKAATTSA